MATTYYRLHDTDRCSPEDLLHEEHQVSRVWVGVMYRPCTGEDCMGGVVEDEDGEVEGNCPVCHGEGQEPVEEQIGVSACRSLDDLRAYLAARSPYVGASTVVVEMEGEELEEQDMDAAAGAVLVRPTRIVSVTSPEAL